MWVLLQLARVAIYTIAYRNSATRSMRDLTAGELFNPFHIIVAVHNHAPPSLLKITYLPSPKLKFGHYVLGAFFCIIKFHPIIIVFYLFFVCPIFTPTIRIKPFLTIIFFFLNSHTFTTLTHASEIELETSQPQILICTTTTIYFSNLSPRLQSHAQYCIYYFVLIFNNKYGTCVH